MQIRDSQNLPNFAHGTAQSGLSRQKSTNPCLMIKNGLEMKINKPNKGEKQ